MQKQKPLRLFESEEGETVATIDVDITKGRCNIVHVFSESVKYTNILEETIDEMSIGNNSKFKCDEREVIQRWLCMPPMFDMCKNSVNDISNCMDISREKVNAVINKFKQMLWSKMNGKNTDNN